MAQNVSEALEMAAHAVWRDRVNYFMLKEADKALKESAATAYHAARVAYAVTIINGNYNINQAAVACITNPTLLSNANKNDPPQFGIVDNDLEFTVNSIFSSLGGIDQGV